MTATPTIPRFKSETLKPPCIYIKMLHGNSKMKEEIWPLKNNMK